MAFTYWGNVNNLFWDAGAPDLGDVFFRPVTSRFGFSNIWADFTTPSNGFASNGVNVTSLQLTAQGQLGSVWHYSVPVASFATSFALAGTALFNSSGSTIAGGIFWFEPDAADPNGPFDLKFETLAFTPDNIPVLTGETPTPPAITTGAPVTLLDSIAGFRSADWNNNSTHLEIGLSVDGATGATRDILLHGFSTTGTATSGPVLAVDELAAANTWQANAISASGLGVTYEDSAATRSLVFKSFDAVTGALGAAQSLLTPYADIGSFNARRLPSGTDYMLAVEGVTAANAHTISVYMINTAFVSTLTATITLTSPFSAGTRLQTDTLPNGELFLAYSDNSQVHFTVLSAAGAVISDQIIPGYTGFDRARHLGDGRVEIVGRVFGVGSNNGPVNATIYDLRTGAISETLTSGDDNRAGTGFADTISGAAGNDRIVGGAGNDTLNGDAGNDLLDGGDGDDTVIGGADNDVIQGGRGNDSLDGGSGINTVVYIDADSAVNVRLGTVGGQNTGGAGTDTLSNFQNIQGSGFDDTLRGTAGVNLLAGNGGDDTARGLAGADILSGGSGDDFALYDEDAAAGGVAGVVVNLSAASVNVGGVVAALTARDGFGDIDTLISIERARGTSQADSFFGGTGANFFQGRAGADTYHGGNSVAFFDDYYGLDEVRNWVDYRQDGGGAGVTLTLTDGSGGNTGGGGTDTFGATETFINISNIRGSMNADSLTGNRYHNWFEGLGGIDAFNGGAGYDTVNYARDEEFGGAGAITVNLQAGTAADGFGNVESLTAIENVYGTTGDDSFTGNAWDNEFRGFGGNDSFVGADGFDIFRPGLGTDTLDGTAGANGDQSHDDRDRVSYNELRTDSTSLGVIINLSAVQVTYEAYTINAGRARDSGGFIDTLIDIEHARGTMGRDYFRGSDTANLRNELFYGLGGDDLFDGGAGYNVVNYDHEVAYFGGLRGVIVNLSAASITANGATVAAGRAIDAFGDTDTLIGIRGIIGTTLADHVVGGAGYDFFRTRGGADFFDGGAGIEDVISFDDDELEHGITGAGAVVNLATGTATTWLDAMTTTFLNVESVEGSGRNDSITGDGSANTLSGDLGNDTISGAGGDDVVNGGQGNDALAGAEGFDIVSYLYDPGRATYFALQRAFFGFGVAGGATVNLATGLATDHYGGTDTLSGFEGVTGTFLNDTLIGNAGANIFYGLSGNDTINGGGGIDTVSYQGWGATSGSGSPALVGINASRPNGVVVNLTTGTANDGEGGTDTLLLIENVVGSTGIDTITGSALANLLEGREGADTLDGRGGIDTLIGGIGDDGYVVDNAGDQTVEAQGEGTDSVNASVSWTLALNLENLTLLTGAANGTGNELANIITGNAANNTLRGQGGIDTLIGGAGSDTYYVDATTEVVTEALNAGADTVYSSASFTLSANVEELILTGTAAINGTGNTLANQIFGNSAVNTLLGGAGADQLTGGGGADIMNGGEDGDVYNADLTDVINDTGAAGVDRVVSVGGYTLATGNGVEQLQVKAGNSPVNIILAGNELGNTIIGNDGASTLRGNAGNDTLIGNGGIDRLEGGLGRDVLTGGTGADIFDFDAGGTTATAFGFDTVTDFVTGAGGDRIDLDVTIGATQYAETLISGTSFANALSAAQLLMNGGAIRAAFVANGVDGWLFWSQDATLTTIEQAVKLNGLGTTGGFAQGDLI